MLHNITLYLTGPTPSAVTLFTKNSDGLKGT